MNKTEKYNKPMSLTSDEIKKYNDEHIKWLDTFRGDFLYHIRKTMTVEEREFYFKLETQRKLNDYELSVCYHCSKIIKYPRRMRLFINEKQFELVQTCNDCYFRVTTKDLNKQ